MAARRKVGRPVSKGGPKTVQTAIRLPVALLEKLDRYTKQLQKQAPYARVTRADAVRALLEKGLKNS